MEQTSDNTVWSRPTFIKVWGEAARTGLFTSREGKQIPFESKDFKRICSNFKESRPLYFSHDDKTPIGFISKLGYNPDSDKLLIEGYVTNKDRCEKIQKDGYNKISPEFSIDLDNEKGTIKEIFMDAGAFVKVPLFGNDPVSSIPVCFGDPISQTNKIESKNIEVKNFMTEPKITTNPDGTYSITIGTATGTPNANTVTSSGTSVPTTPTVTYVPVPTPVAPAPTPAPSVNPEEIAAKIKAELTKEKVDPLKNDLQIARNAATEYQTKYNQLITEKINGNIEELKGLGFQKPEEIGTDLSVEQRLNLLTSLKTNFVKSAPATNTNTPTVQVPPADNRAALLQQAKKELGIGDVFDKYIK